MVGWFCNTGKTSIQKQESNLLEPVFGSANRLLCIIKHKTKMRIFEKP
jgi:hypothetical protein